MPTHHGADNRAKAGKIRRKLFIRDVADAADKPARSRADGKKGLPGKKGGGGGWWLDAAARTGQGQALRVPPRPRRPSAERAGDAAQRTADAFGSRKPSSQSRMGTGGCVGPCRPERAARMRARAPRRKPAAPRTASPQVPGRSPSLCITPMHTAPRLTSSWTGDCRPGPWEPRPWLLPLCHRYHAHASALVFRGEVWGVGVC